MIDEGTVPPLSEQTATAAVVAAATYCGFSQGVIGVRIASDAEIHRINREYLGHDYSTDVISFSYAAEKPWLEGELIASCDTARRSAEVLGWSVANELLLYIVHGTLHIAGMDDQDDDDRAAMRDAEQHILSGLGVTDMVQYGADRQDGSAAGGRR